MPCCLSSRGPASGGWWPSEWGRAGRPARRLPHGGTVGTLASVMIELTLVGVRLELPTNSPIVLLREREGRRYLPIWIGQNEAQAIAIAQQGEPTPRPLTHDLMKSLLDETGVQVDRIVITELREGIFYAVIQLSRNGSSFEVSSRPSDAIALAVRASVPIFANDEVLTEAAIDVPEGDEDEQEVERFREFLENVQPEDFA